MRIIDHIVLKHIDLSLSFRKGTRKLVEAEVALFPKHSTIGVNYPLQTVPQNNSLKRAECAFYRPSL